MPETYGEIDMLKKSKRINQLFLVGALVSIILLATSLSNLQLQSGSPFPGSGISEGAAQPVTPLPQLQTYSFPLLQGLFSLIFLVLMIYVSVRLILLANIKRILQIVLALVILLMIVYMLPRVTPAQPAYLPVESSVITNPPSFDYFVTPLGQPPLFLTQFVTIGILLGIGLLAIMVIKQRLNTNKIEPELIQEAEQAVNALNAGVDLRNVILRCYMQMARLLQEEQGIERNYTMTVREFERLLANKGLPTVPLHQLTSLFEKVRYGNQQMMDTDEQIAIDSLNEIIRFSRGERA